MARARRALARLRGAELAEIDMHRFSFSYHASLLALVLSSATAHAGVIVVAAGGGGSFTDLPGAVNAAVDGDVLLVKSGGYSGFAIANKSLDIVADTGAAVVITATVSVTTLAVTRTVTLSGLTVQSASLTDAVSIVNCAGAVRVQGCSLQPMVAPNCIVAGSARRAMQIVNSSDVCVARCTLQGANGNEQGQGAWGGGVGLYVEGSRCAVYDSTLLAGHGGNFSGACGAYAYGYAGVGGVGLWSQFANLVFASGCVIRGGNGGDLVGMPGEAGCGRPGWINTLASGGLARRLDTTIAGGLQGSPPLIYCMGNAPPVEGPHPLVALPAPSRTLNAVRVQRETDDMRITVRGVPGERVELLFADQPAFEYSDAWHGARLVPWKRSPVPVMQLGVLPGNGELQLAIPLVELGPGVAARRLFLQAKHDGTGTGPYLGPVAIVVVLDSAY